MKPKSKRCGIVDTCPHGDRKNTISGCTKFSDRNLCSKSNKQRRRAANHARRRADINFVNRFLYM